MVAPHITGEVTPLQTGAASTGSADALKHGHSATLGVGWRSQSESYALLLARVCALVTLCAVPISTAGVNLGSGLVLLFALLSPEAWRACRKIFTSPVNVAALTLFAVLGLSIVYSAASHDEAFSFLLKYRKLLMLPVLFVVFYGSDRSKWQVAAIWGLFSALTLSMLLTYTNFFGWTAVGPMHGSDPMTKAWVFKDHISGGLMMAFLGYLAMALATTVRKGIGRWLLYLVAALAMVNVLFVLEGRTGQVVAIAYMVVFVAVQLLKSRRQDRRTRWIATVASVAVCLCLVAYAFTAKHSRLAETGQEIQQFEVYNQNTSMGVRLEFYQRSLALIRERPIFGYGAGSVRPEFEKLAKNSTGGHAAMASNPHNEFFLMGVQLGLLGVALFVWLLVAVGRECRRVDTLAATVVGGYLLAFVLGCFANSLLLNFTEGNLFILLTGILLFGGSSSQGSPDS
ncbi:O-antigen ligase [Paraburkholderia sp. GAS38]|uniref:O-antigen ligase family protein n=1 Tax=Paraburkholderia sp. GAS38 TaxID=3035133 RepID=UPI003D1B83B5